MPEKNLKIIDLGQLFSVPLLAIVEADFMTAERFLYYISEFGFSKKKPTDLQIEDRGIPPVTDPNAVAPDEWGKIKMVSFSFHRENAQGQPEKIKVEIPALSLVPLPLLQVKEATFDFEVNILEAIENESETTRPGLMEDPDKRLLPDPLRYRWNAMFVKDVKDKSKIDPHISSNLKATVKIAQADLPAGINTLLQLMDEHTQSMTTVFPRLDIDCGNDISISIGDKTEKYCCITVIGKNGHPAADHPLEFSMDATVFKAFKFMANGRTIPSSTTPPFTSRTNSQGLMILGIKLNPKHTRLLDNRLVVHMGIACEVEGQSLQSILNITIEQKPEPSQ